MAMNSSERYDYDKCISDGDWHMRKGAENEGYRYWGEAKDHYYHAMCCYQEAYNIARSADDYAQYSANSSYNEAQSSFRSISQKSYDDSRTM